MKRLLVLTLIVIVIASGCYERPPTAKEEYTRVIHYVSSYSEGFVKFANNYSVSSIHIYSLYEEPDYSVSAFNSPLYTLRLWNIGNITPVYFGVSQFTEECPLNCMTNATKSLKSGYFDIIFRTVENKNFRVNVNGPGGFIIGKECSDPGPAKIYSSNVYADGTFC
jgi:hypothetical protein